MRTLLLCVRCFWIVYLIPHDCPHRAFVSSDAVVVAVVVYFVGGEVPDAVSRDVILVTDLADAAIVVLWHVSFSLPCSKKVVLLGIYCRRT